MNTELSQRSSGASSRRRGAFTMIELLVSMAISLVVVYALVEFMKQIGDTVSDGRAMIDLATQLRGVRQRLNEDLQSLTAQTRPWSDNGYFEYREGPIWDADADGNGTIDSSRTAVTAPYNIEGNGGNTLFGDWDDVLAFTAHAGIEPFVGQFNGGPAQSQVAEIIWFTGFDDQDGDNIWDANEPRFIHRRVLLVNPQLFTNGIYPRASDPAYPSMEAALGFWQNNDVSGRIVQTGMSEWRIQANTLADLSRRENRFAHQPGFPGRLNFDPSRSIPVAAPPANALPFGSQYYVLGKHPSMLDVRLGEDVMLSRVLAFDVQVFDPDASIKVLPTASDPTNAALTPDSPLWDPNLAEIGRGAYVDLGYSAATPLPMPSPPKDRYGRTPTNLAAGMLAYPPNNKSGFGSQEWIWDSWSTSYESDGNKQNSSATNADEAHDGLDNDNQNGVDDIGERDTSPPYPVPIRGIKVTMRIYDPTTRQVRQGTVTAEFMPE